MSEQSEIERLRSELERIQKQCAEKDEALHAAAGFLEGICERSGADTCCTLQLVRRAISPDAGRGFVSRAEFERLATELKRVRQVNTDANKLIEATANELQVIITSQDAELDRLRRDHIHRDEVKPLVEALQYMEEFSRHPEWNWCEIDLSIFPKALAHARSLGLLDDTSNCMSD